MPYFFIDYYYIILVIPAMLIALWAQYKVKSTYKKFSKIDNSKRITGAYAAQAILTYYGISDVRIVQTSGQLTDHYDPKDKVIRLSDGVYNSTSVAAVGIACHEAGHAAQHAENYVPIKVRNSLVPVCKVGSTLGLPLAIAGYFFGFEPLIAIGLLLYSAITVFQLVTLPVEFNASRRAVAAIKERELLVEDELDGTKKVLSAAAMTYVASTIVALANLLRLVLRFRRSN